MVCQCPSRTSCSSVNEGQWLRGKGVLLSSEVLEQTEALRQVAPEGERCGEIESPEHEVDIIGSLKVASMGKCGAVVISAGSPGRGECWPQQGTPGPLSLPCYLTTVNLEHTSSKFSYYTLNCFNWFVIAVFLWCAQSRGHVCRRLRGPQRTSSPTHSSSSTFIWVLGIELRFFRLEWQSTLLDEPCYQHQPIEPLKSLKMA